MEQREHPVEVVREPAREVAVQRFEVDPEHIGEQMGAAFGGVAGYLGRHGVAMTGSALTHYTVRGDGMEAAAGFEVAEPFEGGDGVEWFVLPEAEAVTTVHAGPYDRLDEAYGALSAHAAAIGRPLDESQMWEEYLTGPDVPPDQIRTRVVWPLLPA